ncbi:MAG: hypothetical protein BAJALOKI1v1_260017 [Promethearchaeota archaeon]|nr:MAG: hypothetical protein BAJALOKI1v1_260017 [Candidatus Lokiarchaeota archaeon]
MSEYLKKFFFKKEPQELRYNEEDPLKLTEEFKFYHNKLKFRIELNQLQYLFQDYMKVPLQAAGIRDTYLKLEYTDKYYMVIFTDMNTIKNANQIIEENMDVSIEKGCYYLRTTPTYMLLLAKDYDGIDTGITMMREILDQVLHDYFRQQEFDEFIKVQPFTLQDCASYF